LSLSGNLFASDGIFRWRICLLFLILLSDFFSCRPLNTTRKVEVDSFFTSSRPELNQLGDVLDVFDAEMTGRIIVFSDQR